MWGRNRWVKIGVLGFVLVLLLHSGPGYASDKLRELREKLKQVESDLERSRGKLRWIDNQRQTVLRELRRMEENLERTEAELASLQGQVTRTEEEVAQAAEELREAEAELARRKELLARRARALYEMGNVTYLEVLFGARTFADFVTRLSFLKTIIEGDSTLVTRTAEQRDQVAAKKAALEDTLARLEKLHAAAAEKKRRIEAQAAERGRLLDRLEKDKAAYEEAVRELERESKELGKVIRELQASLSGGRLGGAAGTFQWPVPGRVTSPFGPRIHPIFRTRSFHTGIDIGAPWGASVRAAHHGVVLYTGWLGGYGKVVIVGHGKGVSTVYAHNSSFVVGEDEGVTQGQVIARVGSTGFSTGPHVHFEVRVDGEPVDPLGWLR